MLEIESLGRRKTRKTGPRTSTPKRGGTTGRHNGKTTTGDPKGGKHNGEMIQNEKCHFYKCKNKEKAAFETDWNIQIVHMCCFFLNIYIYFFFKKKTWFLSINYTQNPYMIHIWITKHYKPLPEIKSKVWGFGIPKVTKMKSHELRFGILLTRPRMPKIKSKVWQTSIDIS